MAVDLPSVHEQALEQFVGVLNCVQTYLRLSGYKLGFLLNFGEGLMKRGITRAVNGLDEDDSYLSGPLGATTRRYLVQSRKKH